MKKILNLIKKYPRKRVIAVCLATVIIILLAVMPLATARKSNDNNPEASILSDTVKKGNVNTILIGAGTLSQQEPKKINIPSEVKIKRFIVSNGDSVTKGDALAEIDKVTLMQAITDVQETMDYIREEMETAKDSVSTDKVISQQAGTVKAVYAEKGDDVNSVMLEYGTLAVLSLDGLMSVETESDEPLSAGENVKIIFNDKTEATGTVKTYLNNIAKITFEDKNYTEGVEVTVTKEDGTQIGSGKIQINSRWNATAYSGTVSSVKISENEAVSSGEALFALENVSSTARYDTLATQHRKYEKLMLSLFEMYQNGAITAPNDGIVSGIDKDSTLLLSSTGDVSFEFLANSPDGKDEPLYNNFIGKVITINGDLWNVNINPLNQAVADYKELSTVDFSEDKMTVNENFSSAIPVYELNGETWSQVAATDIKPDDLLLFASTNTTDIVWAVRIQKGSSIPPATNTEPSATPPSDENTTQPSTDGSASPPSSNNTTSPAGNNTTQPSGSGTARPSSPSDNTATQPSNNDMTMPSGSSFAGGSFTGGSLGNGFSGIEGTQQPSEEFELYDLVGITVLSVTPQDTMSVTVSIDELDLSKIQTGMTAEITLDAFVGESFEGTISKIGTTGENSGGNSKFSVDITLKRTTNMLEGMSATAKIILATEENVLTVPVEAISEVGNKAVIYTKYNKSDEALEDPVAVTLGISDGSVVQILSGLSEGQEYYYSYYDEYRSTENSSSLSFSGFGMGGFGGSGNGNGRPGR